jgi:hypothetical protein
MFAGTPLAADAPIVSEGRTPLWKSYYIKWLNVRYEQDLASADWSAEQVDHQLALIENLREATSSSVALQALRQARMSLLEGRGEEETLPEG